jgi:hypothetical protein
LPLQRLSLSRQLTADALKHALVSVHRSVGAADFIPSLQLGRAMTRR